MARVVVENLCVRYGELTAVDGVSFSAEPGEITVLLGPNGAGKTSTIECLEGYRSPTGGTARIDGLDPVADHRRLSHRVGVMLQNGGIYTGIRVGEAAELFASYYDDPLDPHELLGRVGLDERRRSTWRSLSGGEQQRLSLALCLIGRPDVAFLDEPTAGVDVRGRQVIHDVVRELRSGGVTVLITTHDLDEAEQLADRIVIIDGGQVVADGAPESLLDAAGSGEFTFRAAAGLDVASIGGAVGGAVLEGGPGEYRVLVAPSPTAVAAVTGWLAEHDQLLDDLRAGRHRLNDVFLALTAEPSVAGAATGRRPRGVGRRGARGPR